MRLIALSLRRVNQVVYCKKSSAKVSPSSKNLYLPFRSSWLPAKFSKDCFPASRHHSSYSRQAIPAWPMTMSVLATMTAHAADKDARKY